MRYVIVGGGAASTAAAETLRRLDSDSSITLISEEERVGYYRPLIPHLIDDGFPEERFLREPDFFSALGVEVIAGAKVRSIDSRGKVADTPGDRVPYDRLLLATGGRAAAPAVKGLDPEDALTLRSFDDGLKIAQASARGRKAVVIGGGRVGILAALALRAAGLDVTVVEMLGHVLPLQLDATAASIIAAAVEARGVRLMAGRQVKEIKRESSGLKTAMLDDGCEVPFDLLVVAVGVHPRLELARQMGADVDRGVVVNAHLQTSVPDIFAAGDAVQLDDLATGEGFVSGTWTNAVEMGTCAAFNMAGAPREYQGSFFVQNAVTIAGIPTIAVGAVHAQGPEFEIHAHRQGNSYRKLVFKGSRLAGMLFIGDVDKAGIYRTLIREGRDVSRIKDQMISGALSYAAFLRKSGDALAQASV